MKRLVRNLLIFVGVVVVIDVCYGFVCGYLQGNAKFGGTAKRMYVAKKSTEDIMMFGSSRMMHHYVPRVISDSLGMTCFNAGEDGNCIILAYGYLQMIMKRHVPKLVIYEIFSYDIKEDDKSKYLSLLKPHCDDPDVKELVCSVFPDERFKMLSSLYRYNSIMPLLLAANVGGATEYQNGYEPLRGVMDYEPDAPILHEIKEDTLKLRLIKDFISLCHKHDVPVVFCVSPSYKGYHTDVYDKVKRLCESEGAYFWNYFDCKEIVNGRSLFQDQMHMNDAGARKYTSIVVQRLKDVVLTGGKRKSNQ